MPEIAEVARTVHFIKKNLVGKTIAKVHAAEDANVYGKVGTSADEFKKHMSGKKIIDAGRQGKYFWMIMSTPPHPVMHFGMNGWIKFKTESTFYYRKRDVVNPKDWPPKAWKFQLEMKPEKGEDPVICAFTDTRRFGRIRLLDCPGDKIRQYTPLKENGPDPVIDKHLVTVDWLMKKCRSKKVPIKAMLLDQANISGIGNWVGDEIMFHAKMHPEQYAYTLSDEQIVQLHKSLHYVCDTAVELLADSDKFPKDWLFKHRWGRGKFSGNRTMPNGDKIVFLTVGGRTSAVVPAIQKKTGPVAKEMSEAEDPDEKPTKGKKRKKAEESEDEEEDDVESTPPRPRKAAGTKKVNEAKESNRKPAQAKKKQKAEEKDEDADQEIDGNESSPPPPPKKAVGRKKATAPKAETMVNGDTPKPKPMPKSKSKPEPATPASKSRSSRKVVKEEHEVKPEEDEDVAPPPAKSSKSGRGSTKAKTMVQKKQAEKPAAQGTRRSLRSAK